MIQPRPVSVPTVQLKKNPFADLQAAHEQVVAEEKALPYEERLHDWIHVKPSMNGSSSPKRVVTLLLPVSGISITI